MGNDDEAFGPDDDELAELEAEDLTDREVEAIRRSQQEPDTPDSHDSEVS